MTLLAWLLMVGWLSFPVRTVDDQMSPPKPIRVLEDYPSPPKPRVQDEYPTPPKPRLRDDLQHHRSREVR